jgi:hypothetical protein
MAQVVEHLPSKHKAIISSKIRERERGRERERERERERKRERGSTDICYNTDELQKYHSKQKKKKVRHQRPHFI